jgi:hypothetical protein
MKSFGVNDIEMFASDIPGAQGLVVANLDELYITNLMGHTVSRVKGAPGRQKLYHQM